MSFFNKLAFWKKEDDFDFDKMADQELHHQPLTDPPIQDNLGLESSDPNFQQPQPAHDPFASPPPTSPPPDHFNQQQHSSSPSSGSFSSQPMQNKDMELLNSKLDTIKALLASLDQRMANIEHGSSQERKQQGRLW